MSPGAPTYTEDAFLGNTNLHKGRVPWEHTSTQRTPSLGTHTYTEDAFLGSPHLHRGRHPWEHTPTQRTPSLGTHTYTKDAFHGSPHLHRGRHPWKCTPTQRTPSLGPGSKHLHRGRRPWEYTPTQRSKLHGGYFYQGHQPTHRTSSLGTPTYRADVFPGGTHLHRVRLPCTYPPTQRTPSPVKPSRQRQSRLPGWFTHSELSGHPPFIESHSFTSETTSSQ